MLVPLILLTCCVPHELDDDLLFATRDPATHAASKLCLAQIELVEMQTLYQAKHPLLKQQQRRVRVAVQALRALREQGYQVDEQRINALLDVLKQQTLAELKVARQELTSSHPRLAMLELHLQSLAHVASQRALLE